MTAYPSDLKDTKELEAILPSRYKIVRLLGQGAGGAVVLAEDSLLGREVAIKILNLDDTNDERLKTRFLQEAKALATLDHPNVLKILSSELTENGHPFHVMEYLHGTTLSEQMKGEPLSKQLFFEVFTQIASGLACAHNAGIIHRDLKPSNIFLCTESETNKTQAKLIDFGISRLETSAGAGKLTKTNALIGTPAYMSPEQCRSDTVTKKSDIYSLACIMYEALSGRAPFKAESQFELMYKHLNEQAPALTSTSKEAQSTKLSSLISRCLEKDPDKRPASSEIVLKELQDCESSSSGCNSNFSRSKPDKKVYLAIAAGLALIFTLLAALYIKNKEPGAKEGSNEYAAELASSRKSPEERLEIELDRLKKEHDNANTATKKAVYSNLILNKVNDIGDTFHNEEKIIQTLESLLPYVASKNFTKGKRRVYRLIAARQHKLGRQDEALKNINLSMASGFPESLDAIETLSVRAAILVSHNRFVEAKNDVKKAGKIMKTYLISEQDKLEQSIAGQMGNHKIDMRSAYLFSVFDLLKSRPEAKSTKERLQRIELAIAVIQAMITRSIEQEQKESLISYIDHELKLVPPDSRQAIELKTQFNDLKAILAQSTP